MSRTSPRLVAILAGLVLGAAAFGQAPTTPLSLERAIQRAFEARDHRQAIELISRYLEQRPNDAQMLYNLACAHSRLGETDDAAGALLRAVKAGFRDFAHMRTDPELDAIRKEPMYEAILEAAARVEGERAEDALARWKRTYGEERYRYEIDDARRLSFATALDETSHAEMRAMLQQEADHLARTLFGEPPEYYVLIAVPAPDDADALFGGDASIGGRYEHWARRLIARDIGGSLRHEFFHAMHYGHMERLHLRQPHALWVQEGLAALYEDYELADSGAITFLPNERRNVVVNRAKIGRLARWREFFTQSGERFMARAGANYPQARAIFEFLAEEGKLVAWYRAYVEHFDEDATGIRAFEVTFDRPLEEIEKSWRLWALKLPKVDLRIERGDASLGISADVNTSNDGVLIAEVLPGSAASRAKLRKGDVIVALDGQPTRSLRELMQFIGARAVGDSVEVKARRADRYFTVTVVLQPLRPG